MPSVSTVFHSKLLDVPDAEQIVQRLVVEANNNLGLLKLPKNYEPHIQKIAENFKKEFANSLELQTLNKKLSLAHLQKQNHSKQLGGPEEQTLKLLQGQLLENFEGGEVSSMRVRAKELR